MSPRTPRRPKRSIHGAAVARACSRESPRARSASAALSSVPSHGSSRSRWGIRAAGALTIVPESGGCRPQISSSSVVLPQPLGPTTATISWGAARSDIPDSACTGPRLVANVRLTSSTRTPTRSSSSRGSSIGASIITRIAPSAGITPQVRRVSARPQQRARGAISAGFPASPPGFSDAVRRCYRV